MQNITNLRHEDTKNMKFLTSAKSAENESFHL